MINVTEREKTELTTPSEAGFDASAFLSRHALLLIAISAFILRLSLLPFRFAVAFDEVNYLKLGVSGHLNGLTEVLHSYWSPLLPFVISIASAFFEDYEFAARLVSVLAGTILVFPVFYLGKSLFSHRAGLVAAAFVAFYPPLAFQSTQILTEPLMMLLAAVAILCGLQALERGSFRQIVLAGMLTGGVYLLHPQGIGFGIVIIGWLLLAAAMSVFTLQRSRSLLMALALVLAFIVVASPYLIYLKQSTGHWTLSAKGAANQQFEAYSENGETDPFRSLDSENKRVLFDLIFHQGEFLQQSEASAAAVTLNIGGLLKKYVNNVYDMLKRGIPEFLTLLPLLLLALGLFGENWLPNQGRKIAYLMSFVGFFWFVVIPMFHITERYMSPLWPVCAVFIGNGIVYLYEWLRDYGPIRGLSGKVRMSSGTITVVTLASALFLFSFAPELGKVLMRTPYSTDYWAPPVEQKTAGLWLKKHDPGHKVLMSRYQTVDIYAGNYDIHESITIPDNELPRVLAYARHRGVDYLVLNERYKEDNKKLAFLYHTENAPDGLQKIYERRDPNGLKTLIFKVL